MLVMIPMEKQFHFNKKALSTVVASVIMILLVVSAVFIVGTYATKILRDNIESSENCMGVSEKVLLDKKQTCYNLSARELNLFIEVKDIEIDELLVSIADNSKSKTFTIKKESTQVDNVLNYEREDSIKIPSKNSGELFIIDLEEEGIAKPTDIKIAPKVGKTTCDISDRILQIQLC